MASTWLSLTADSAEEMIASTSFKAAARLLDSMP